MIMQKFVLVGLKPEKNLGVVVNVDIYGLSRKTHRHKS